MELRDKIKRMIISNNYNELNKQRNNTEIDLTSLSIERFFQGGRVFSHETKFDFGVLLICLEINKDMNENLFDDSKEVVGVFVSRFDKDFSINAHNVRFLLENLTYQSYYDNNPCYLYLARKVYENDIDDLINWNNRALIKNLLNSKYIDEGLMDYILDKIKDKQTMMICFYEPYNFFEKVIKVLDCNIKNEYGLDCLLYCVFNNKIKNIEIMVNNGIELSTNKLDEENVDRFIGRKKYVELESILLISSLENFDDFVKNNSFVLMKICDKEAMNYLLRNFDIEFN